MDKHEKAINGLLNAGIIAEALRMMAFFLVRSFPETVLRLMHQEIPHDDLHRLVTNPLPYLRPVLHFGIVLVLFFLLRSENRKTSPLSGVFPVLVPVTAVVLSVAGGAAGYFISFFINRLNNTSTVAYNSMLNTASTFLMLFIPSGMLLFTLAAGAIWYRRKQTEE